VIQIYNRPTETRKEALFKWIELAIIGYKPSNMENGLA
jgi:hypothetical protein